MINPDARPFLSPPPAPQNEARPPSRATPSVPARDNTIPTADPISLPHNLPDIFENPHEGAIDAQAGNSARSRWVTAAKTVGGFVAGGAVGTATGLVVPPLTALGLINAGQGIAIFGPPLALVATITDRTQTAGEAAYRLIRGALMVPFGALIAAEGLALLTFTPLISPTAAALTGFSGALAGAGWGSGATRWLTGNIGN